MKQVVPFVVYTVVLGVILGAMYLFMVAPKSHTHELTPTDIYDGVEDGAYDDSFLETQLAGTDTGELSRYARPLYVQFLTRDGSVVGRPVFGMGVLCGHYVVTSSVIFSAANAGIEDPSQVTGVSVIIRPNTNFDDRGREEEILVRDFEKDTLYINPERGFVIFPRPKETLLPEPAGCGVAVGIFDDLSVGDVLVEPGFYANAAPFDLDTGTVSAKAVDTDTFVFQGTVEPSDFGSPVFAFRDGKPELVGITVASFTRIGNESKAVALSMESIVKEVENATGVNLLDAGETK